MRLSFTLSVALLLLPLAGAHAQQTSEEAAIRSVLARETDGWNNFNAKEGASTFTKDAIWQNPFGVRLHGNKEIEKFLTDLLARPGYRSGKSTAPTTILDVRGDKRIIKLLHRALSQGRVFRVPAGVAGRAWRSGGLQVTLARFLRSDEVEIVPLDEQLARSCGELCGAAGTSDIIDASVVILARERQDPIVTSDPSDLRRLDHTAYIIVA